MAEQVQSGPGATGSGTQSDYLAQRQLRAGSASWVLLAGLGVAYVISGDYAGWHFGLAQGGWGGLAIAAVLMAVMYTCMVLSLAEMSASLPAAGGGYTFARVALGPWGGFATGAAILLEYAVAPAAIATFIGGYVESLGLFGITDGWWIYLACYVLFVGIHLLGAGEALTATFVVTAIAAVALVVFALGTIGSFDAGNLFDIPATDATGASAFLPFGLVGIWASFPFAIWFFLAVEGVPLAAEEAKDPVHSVPRGIVVAMIVLIAFAAVVLILGAGAAGSQAMSTSDNPLVTATDATGSAWLSTVINYVGLLGLVASFFSIIYAYSRQTFALSRAGYLPRVLSRTNGRKAPTLALIVPGILGFALAATGDGDILINLAVFGATLSYVLMMISHLVLRARQPQMPRPYRTPGGTVTSSIALVLAVAAVVATFLVDVVAALCALGAFALLMAWFGFYSRHHLVAAAPDEEFAALAAAEDDVR